MDQVAMRGVNFEQVEACACAAPRTCSELLDDAGNVGFGHPLGPMPPLHLRAARRREGLPGRLAAFGLCRTEGTIAFPRALPPGLGSAVVQLCRGHRTTAAQQLCNL